MIIIIHHHLDLLFNPPQTQPKQDPSLSYHDFISKSSPPGDRPAPCKCPTAPQRLGSTHTSRSRGPDRLPSCPSFHSPNARQVRSCRASSPSAPILPLGLRFANRRTPMCRQMWLRPLSAHAQEVETTIHLPPSSFSKRRATKGRS